MATRIDVSKFGIEEIVVIPWQIDYANGRDHKIYIDICSCSLYIPDH